MVFLSLRARPSLADLPWIPRAWVFFFDGHDFLNNVVGFGGLAGAVHFAFARSGAPRRDIIHRAGVLACVVFVLELAQSFRPMRSCDWRDVLAGWLGITTVSMPWLAFPGLLCRRVR